MTLPYEASTPSRSVASSYHARASPSVFLGVWAVLTILLCQAALVQARHLPRNHVPSGPSRRLCPCVNSESLTSQPARNQSLDQGAPAGNSSFAGSRLLYDLFPPGFLQNSSICNDLLQMFPPSWNATGEQGNRTKLPPGKVLAEEINAGCKRTCAVVGSGSRLSASRHGTEIDSADVIIRMNDAPVQGYEQDVGRRTSIRLVFPKSYVAFSHRVYGGHDLSPDLYVMRCEPWCYPIFDYLPKGIPVPHKLLKRNHINADIEKYPNETAKLLVLKEDVFRVAGAFTKGKATTGSVSVALAMLACSKVVLYGFGQPGETWYSHYYDRKHRAPKGTEQPKNATILQPSNATNLHRIGKRHDFPTEWQMWQRFRDAGLLVYVP